MTFKGLVPEDSEEFRSVNFWDGFFKKRNQKAFEWYGEWQQLQPLVWGVCSKPNKQILMLGCGNSDLSARMYDAGCRAITNIDFSKVCIKEMLMKNLRKRPQMRWMVMDMTQLTFKAGNFHVAIDKGALDALMGEDTQAADTAGSKLLTEVQRVLDPVDGCYICVTLAQTHVLTKLLSSFGSGWSISIDRVPPSPDMAKSPLQPLLVTVSRHHDQQQQQQQREEEDGQIEDVEEHLEGNAGRKSNSGTAAKAPQVQLTFGKDPRAVNAEQLDDVLQVVEQENGLRTSGGRISEPLHEPQNGPLTPRPAANGPAVNSPASAANSPAPAQFNILEPGRRSFVPLPRSQAGSTDGQTSDSSSIDGNVAGRHTARFTAAVLDMDKAAAKRAVRDCAVFIVPQGREHEWLFASPEGQGQVAEGCSAKRVIIVSLNRGHAFGNLKAVQGELSPLVMGLAPIGCRLLEAAIPFMTTQEGIGSRTVLETAESALTGSISIEDVSMPSEAAHDTTVRRMVFTSNRNLVQSEAVLCSITQSHQATATSAAGVTDAGAGKKSKGKGKTAKQKAASAGTSKDVRQTGGQVLAVDHSQLACDYHKGVVAGLSLIQPHLNGIAQSGTAQQAQQAQQVQQAQHAQQQTQTSPVPAHGSDQQPGRQQQAPDAQEPGHRASDASSQDAGASDAQPHGGQGGRPQAMVVGLGGGGLPVFLNRHCGMDVQSVELDPVVVELARRHFGLEDSATLQARVGDGLEAVAKLAHRLNSDSAAQSAHPLTPETQRLQDTHQTDRTQSSATQSSAAQSSAITGNSPHSLSNGNPASSCSHLDLLVVDAGSGDATVAMSCPPAAFLESVFLGYAKQVLSPGGMLVVNCVSRAQEPYNAAVKALQAVFAEVYELDVDEDVNRVLFALPQPFSLPEKASPASHSQKASHKGKGGKVALPQTIRIDGSAQAVRLLTPRLHSFVKSIQPESLNALEAMLQNLSIAK